MPSANDYRAKLRTLRDWEPFLLEASGLPGPRANLELIQAVADEGDEERFRRYAALGPDDAPADSPRLFLAVCGVVGLGRLIVEGAEEWFTTLEILAADPRWRVREGVAMALQRVGAARMETLLATMEAWSRLGPYQQRAVVAALCEPALLKREAATARVLALLDAITSSLTMAPDRRSDGVRTLRQALGYGWSVAVAAHPDLGKPSMERWLPNPDADIQWIMRENLRKSRLIRADASWVEAWSRQLARKPIAGSGRGSPRGKRAAR